MHSASPAPTSAGAPASAPLDSLVDLLLERTRTHADKVAYTFFDPERSQPQSLRLGELLEEVAGLAAWLQARGAAGERCVLLLPPGLGYLKAFLACQLAGAAAVPVYLPEPTQLRHSLPWLLQVVGDARARFALTTRALGLLLQPLAAQRRLLSALSSSDLSRRLTRLERPIERLTILGLPESSQASFAGRWREPGVQPQTLSILQYTSGPSSEPKGVALTHGSVLASLETLCGRFGLGEGWRSISWLPPSQEMGLIGSLLMPLYGGFCCELMPPRAFLQQPLRWLEAISRAPERVVSGGPNFALDLCVRQSSAGQRSRLDLRRWEVAFCCGAEPVCYETLRRFAAAFEPCGFRYESFLYASDSAPRSAGSSIPACL